MKFENFDLDELKIGTVTKTDPKRHLANLDKMVITLGEKRSTLTIYGPEKNQGRPRLRRETFLNVSFPRQAREYALNWKILRKNIEIKHENTNT